MERSIIKKWVVGALYSYNDIVNSTTIESTVQDYMNGVIVGYSSSYMYNVFKKRKDIHVPTTQSLSLIIRNYTLIKIIKHYGSQP